MTILITKRANYFRRLRAILVDEPFVEKRGEPEEYDKLPRANDPALIVLGFTDHVPTHSLLAAVATDAAETAAHYI